MNADIVFCLGVIVGVVITSAAFIAAWAEEKAENRKLRRELEEIRPTGDPENQD